MLIFKKMKMKRIFKNVTKFILVPFIALMVSCIDDLDQSNPDSESLSSADEFFNDESSYIQFLAKLYAGLAATGQQGPAGLPDITGIDEGESQYIRGYWLMHELTTDEAVIGWNDKTIKDFHGHSWTAGDAFINATFSRLDFQVKNCNEFLRQTTDEKLDSRGISGNVRTQIDGYRAEARFLRALSYWHFLDLFGSVGLVTEESPTDFFLPEQASRQELFDFVENELLDIESTLPAPRTNEYPRADRGAAWMLLAKLYMNAGVYTSTERYSEAFTYVNNILNAGYTLHDSYPELFFADNDTSGAQNEFIFSVAFDGLNTKTYGGTTFLVHAPVGGSMIASEFGVNGGWAGIRTTSTFVNKFGTHNSEFTIYLYDSQGRLVGKDPDADNILKAFDSDGDFEYAGEINNGTNPDFDADDVYYYDYETGVITNDEMTVSAPAMAVSAGTQFVWNDTRGLFYNNNQTIEITDIADFTSGYAIRKWRNIDTNGNPGSDTVGDFTDTDFPMFRLADTYLMYAEIFLRGGGGSANEAVNYVNLLRERAYGNTNGNIDATSLTLNFILDERARELYWEAHRRTDLIRFGRFTGSSYVWPWKGNIPGGTGTDTYRDLFPIPSNALAGNPQLQQNPGY